MPVPSSVPNDQTQPETVDVVVIGGGIAGICTALELSERGLSVAVCEKGIVAGEQSSRNWGWCRQMGRDPRELPLMQHSMQLWRQMHQRTGEDVGYRECGVAYLCDTEAKLAKRQKWHDNYVGAHGLSSRMLSQSEANALTPGAAMTWLGGLHTVDDGRAEPTLAVPAMARAAMRSGVHVVQNCAVRGLERQAGQVSGVVTEHGEIACRQVVLAGGAWSRRFCHNAGISLPQLTVINSVMRTQPIDVGIDTSIAAADFAIRKRLDGGYTVAHATLSMADIMPDSFRLLPDFWPVLKAEWRDYRYRIGQRFLDEARLKRHWSHDEVSPFEQVRILDPIPHDGIQSSALKSLQKSIPAFQKAEIAEKWAGVIDVMPDVVPVISPVDQVPGFFMATGFSGHGFGLGPGAGKLMAQLVCGETPCVDPTPFSLNRFH
ncbi:MAG: FAD-binding oxidoreductase [Rhizobiaceae bacterium]|nr:FAD-binding oxidoreductase [Hyphomicrobiales bacterium]NRB29756.1 FAD-binding oxidoreductase [Rhizobiaceae bacterium]